MIFSRPGISCQQLVELVTAYVEGTLPRRQRRRFDAHIAGCEGCSSYVAQMHETIRLTGRLDQDSLDPVARDRLLHAFQGWTAEA